MDEPIEAGVSQRGIAQVGMPVVHGELAGHQGGAPGVAVVEEFQEIAPLVGGERGQAPVVEDEEIGFGEGGEQLGEPAVAVGQSEVFQEARQAVVGGGAAKATGRLGQGATDPGFADAGQDNDILLINGPLKPSFIIGITRAMERACRWWVAAIRMVKPATASSSRMGVGPSFRPG